MDWQKTLTGLPVQAMKALKSFLKNLRASIWSSSRKRTFESSDSGIFDPYLPLGSLKAVEDNYRLDDTISEGIEAVQSNSSQAPNYYLVKLSAVLVGLIFFSRLTTLQITKGQENYQLAEGNRLRTTLVGAPRGLIYDRNGLALVQNIPSYSVVVRPGEIPKKAADRSVFYKNLSVALKQDEAVIIKTFENQMKKETFTLLDGVNRTDSLSIEIRTKGMSGVYLEKQPVRKYLEDVPSLGNLLGYVGKVTEDDLNNRADLLTSSYIGKSGIEYSYDQYLQGTPGQEITEVDSRGRAIRLVGSRPTESGKSIILGLDSGVQKVTAAALQTAIDKTGAKNGAAVMIDVRTGEVIAMVSLPTFSNNLFSADTTSEARQSALNDPGAPLINRAISGQYPSGSTIKPFVAAAGLETNMIKESTKLDTSAGKIEIGQWTFHDWKTHGVTDVKQAIAESNNIFFYSIGGGYKQIVGLGAEKLASWLEKFGFGDKTNIDIPGEKNGLVPTPDWKKSTKSESWYIGDTYNLSIGQGDLLITPLQLVRATSTVANGGKSLQPRLVKSIFSQKDGQEDLPTKVSKDNFLLSDTIRIVSEGMRQAVLTGSARSFSALGVTVAAKTGTAQFDRAKEKTHSWFTAFAPYESPQIAVSVIVEGGGEGYAVAAPIAKNMIEQYFKLPLTPIAPDPEN